MSSAPFFLLTSEGGRIKPSFMALGDLIKKALDESGISQAEIARRLDVTPQAVNGWIRTGTISKKKLAQLARETGSNLEGLMLGRQELRTTAEEETAEYGAPPKRLNGVPIVGHAIATPNADGFFEDVFTSGASDEYAFWKSRDPDAYALRVKGDSMQPRIRPGEVIVVEPNAPLVQGKDVLVRTKDGRKMVKQLLFQRANEVTLGSINQSHPQITLSLDDIESLHFVAGVAHSTLDE
jgi:phage repressor protein C with HTH and peptisase S24 domain